MTPFEKMCEDLQRALHMGLTLAPGTQASFVPDIKPPLITDWDYERRFVDKDAPCCFR